MRTARLLLAAPAATALVFTGMAPAWAGDDDHHNGDDASAEVLEIDDEAVVNDDRDEVKVKFRYECEDGDRRSERVRADVKLDQKHGDAEYEADDVDLDCDGDRHWITVTLDRVDDEEVEDGDKAKVTVTLETRRDGELDEKSQDVDIVDDDDNGDHDHDKGHH